MEEISKTGKELSELIKKSISDHELTTSEYDAILALANKDHVIDAGEKAQLAQLHEMISNGTVKRVPDKQ